MHIVYNLRTPVNQVTRKQKHAICFLCQHSVNSICITHSSQSLESWNLFLCLNSHLVFHQESYFSHQPSLSPSSNAWVSIITSSSSCTHFSSPGGGREARGDSFCGGLGVTDLLGGLKVLLTQGEALVFRGVIGGGDGIRDK